MVKVKVEDNVLEFPKGKDVGLWEKFFVIKNETDEAIAGIDLVFVRWWEIIKEE